MQLCAGSGSSPTSPSPPSLSSVLYFASLHSSVVNAQNSVLPSKHMELSKSKNRKVERFASVKPTSLARTALHSQTEENSDVVSSSCSSMCRLRERKRQDAQQTEC
jgi:hypothetical protein